MKAIWRGQVIAESDRTLEVGGYRYFPRETVRMDLLRAAPKTESDQACPHGVQFYDVTDGTAHFLCGASPSKHQAQGARPLTALFASKILQNVGAN